MNDVIDNDVIENDVSVVMKNDIEILNLMC